MLRRLLILALLITAIATMAQERDPAKILVEISQTSNDSIRGDYYYKLCKIYQGSDLKLARAYADSGYQYFVKYGDIIRAKEKLYYDGVLAYQGGDFPTSLKLLIKYYNWTDSIEHDLRKAYALTMLSKVSRESGSLTDGIRYALEGLELNKSLNYLHDEGHYATELGNMYGALFQWDLSKQYFEQSYEVAKQLDFSIGEAVALRNLGENAIAIEDYDSAEKYFKQALELDLASNYNIGIARSTRNLGQLYDKQQQNELAVEFYHKALEYLKNEDRSMDLAQVHQGLAKVLIKQSDYTTAKNHILLAKGNGENSEALEFKSNQADLESKYFEGVGNQEAALKAAREHFLNYNKMLENNITNQVTGLNIKYETQQKEMEITSLNDKNEITAKQNRNLIGGMIVFGLLSVILLVLLRKIRLQNQVINTALNEKDILLKEIHHRVKNNLQFVSSLLNLQSRSLEDSSAQSALMEGQNRVKSMALIHQNLYQEGNLTGIQIKEYFEKLSSSLFDSYNISPEKINLELDIENVNLDVDTVVPLGLVVNELISNSLKHAFGQEEAGIVKVSLKEAAGYLELIVSDNGKGLDNTAEQSLKDSFGYKLINAFSSQLDADLVLESEDGTSVKLIIKEYTKVA